MAKLDYRKEALRAYRERMGEWVPVALVLFIVLSCAAALSFLGSLWTLFGIAILVLPTLFAVTQYLYSCYAKNENDTRLITRGFLAYFRLPCVGVYRFLFNAFLSFISTMLIGSMFLIIYYMVAYSVDPSFASAAEELANALNSGDTAAVNTILQNSPSFMRMYNISEIVLGFALVFFCWMYMGKYAQNGLLRNAFSLDSPRLANFFYSHYRAVVKEKWLKARWPFLFIPPVLMLVGAGVSAVCYAYGMQIGLSLFIGLASFAFLYALYLPLGLYLHIVFVFDNQGAIGKAFYQGSQKLYSSFASSGTATEEQLARMREDLDKMKPKEEEKDEGEEN